ncbi:MAG: ferrochelatase [Saprospiraceae bacterium]
MGTPDSPSRGDVYKYLKEFLLDKRVIDTGWLSRNLLVRGIIAPFRSGSSAKLYKKLWTEEGSPLKFHGERLQKGVQELLGDDFVVKLAMRYQNPAIESIINKMLAENNIQEMVVLPLFPHYASASTGSVMEEVMRVLSKRQNIPQVKFINSYPDYEPMIEIFVNHAQKFDIDSYDHIVFSFHGLPQRQLKKGEGQANICVTKDCCKTLTEKNKYCYSAQCHATAFALAEKMGLKEDDYSICYQSRLGRDPWVQPYTSDVIEELAERGMKRLLVFCPAFVADCLETTIEVLEEYQEEFEEKGGEHIDLVESLNDDPKWIEAVKDMVLAHCSKAVVSL